VHFKLVLRVKYVKTRLKFKVILDKEQYNGHLNVTLRVEYVKKRLEFKGIIVKVETQ
jgi:hypothetical protein